MAGIILSSSSASRWKARAVFIPPMALQTWREWCHLRECCGCGSSLSYVSPSLPSSSRCRRPRGGRRRWGALALAHGAWGFVCSDQERSIHQQLLKEGKNFRWHFTSLSCAAIFRWCCCQSCQMLCVFWVFAELHNKRFSSLAHNGSVICRKSYYFKWPLILRSIH